MYTPHTYPAALVIMLVSMLCWGSWANTQKIDKAWRFELFYWDYMWGILLCAFLFGLGKDIPIGGTAHQAGTVRFGRDSKTSALDVNCKAHDLDNLYVVDASFFVSIAAVNPSLTIMANALRVGDHLLERLGSTGNHK